MEDSVLISRYKAGDTEAFAALYERHKGAVAAYARALTGSGDDADNIVQEVFLSVIRHADSLTPEGNFRAYLLAKCRGLALNLRRVKAPQTGEYADAAVQSPGPDEVAEGNESAERLARAVAALPDEQREVITLRAHAGMTVNEIAEMLGEPVGTVKSRYRYALEKLKAFFGEDEQ